MARPSIRLIEHPEDLKRAVAVRFEVFVDEQSVDPDLEVDGLDPESTHFLAEAGKRAIGTLRVRFPEGERYGKIERVAVLRAARQQGVGRLLMEAAERLIRERGANLAKLNAQIVVQPFYERLGYTAYGDLFDDAGIPHVAMLKRFDGAE